MDQEHYSGLMSYLVQLHDRRDRRGRKYAWEYLLGCLAAAFAAGAKGPLSIHEWCAGHFPTLVERFGAQARAVPSESTFQRLLQSLDVQHLEGLVEQHNLELAAAAAPPPVALAVDGKVIRQASAHGTMHWLLGLSSQRHGWLLRQVRVPRGTNEQGALPELLAGLDLHGCLLTFDAGLCSRPTAAVVRAAGGDYLMQVKGDCSELYGNLVKWFDTPDWREHGEWAEITKRESGHGRYEVRRLEVSGALAEWLTDWPGAQLVLKRTCQRTCLKTGQQSAPEDSYAICSVSADAASAGGLLSWWRGHWSIENQVHYVRDVTLGEDRRAVWRGPGPQVLAALSNALLARIRAADRWSSAASGLRWASHHAIHAMQLAGLLPL